MDCVSGCRKRRAPLVDVNQICHQRTPELSRAATGEPKQAAEYFGRAQAVLAGSLDFLLSVDSSEVEDAEVGRGSQCD